MASGGARRGRRDNGLQAAVYAVAGDVDPRVGEHLLDLLGLRGIAAYLQPASDLHPVTRTTTLPSRPTDRLYVDRDHLQVARDVLAELGPDSDPAQDSGSGPDPGGNPTAGPADGDGTGGEPGTLPAPSGRGEPLAGRGETLAGRGEALAADRVDDVFASIVADFDTDHGTASGPRPWPEAEDLTEPDDRTGGQPAERSGRTGPGVDPEAGPGVDPGDGTAGGPATAGSGRVLHRWADSTLDPDTGPSLLDGLDTFGTGLPDDPTDEEGYTPPPPPPLPRITAVPVLAVVAIIVGIAVLVHPAILPITESMAMVFGFAGIIGGFITLVTRLRPGDDDDEDRLGPDGGAVV